MTRPIAAAVEKAGGRAVMTRADHASGSDRIFEALGMVDPERRARIVVNVQGDLPTLDAAATSRPRSRRSPIPRSTSRRSPPRSGSPSERDQSERGQGGRLAGRAERGCARSTSPAPPRPSGDGPLYHHIGLYAYRRAALERFVKLPPSPLEQRERLEQLRALEAGMRIDVGDRRQRAARRRHAGGPGNRARACSGGR